MSAGAAPMSYDAFDLRHIEGGADAAYATSDDRFLIVRLGDYDWRIYARAKLDRQLTGPAFQTLRAAAGWLSDNYPKGDTDGG